MSCTLIACPSTLYNRYDQCGAKLQLFLVGYSLNVLHIDCMPDMLKRTGVTRLIWQMHPDLLSHHIVLGSP